MPNKAKLRRVLLIKWIKGSGFDTILKPNGPTHHLKAFRLGVYKVSFSLSFCHHSSICIFFFYSSPVKLRDVEYGTLYIPDLIAIAIANYYLNGVTEQQQTSNNYHKYRKNTPNYNTWIAQSSFSFNRSSVYI